MIGLTINKSNGDVPGTVKKRDDIGQQGPERMKTDSALILNKEKEIPAIRLARNLSETLIPAKSKASLKGAGFCFQRSHITIVPSMKSVKPAASVVTNNPTTPSGVGKRINTAVTV